jgi:hypothetical protein
MQNIGTRKPMAKYAIAINYEETEEHHRAASDTD